MSRIATIALLEFENLKRIQENFKKLKTSEYVMHYQNGIEYYVRKNEFTENIMDSIKELGELSEKMREERINSQLLRRKIRNHNELPWYKRIRKIKQ